MIDFARRHGIVVVQAAAHTVLTYEGAPLSFLAVPGAKEVVIEIHSLSKGFDMIGWRIGWFCGHERIVRALADAGDLRVRLPIPPSRNDRAPAASNPRRFTR